MRYVYKSILIRLLDGVAIVKLNAQDNQDELDVDTKRELASFLAGAKSDSQIKAIVITGKNGTFFTGSSLKISGMAGLEEDRRHNVRRKDLAALIRYMGKPVVAAVNGYAIGAGVRLAQACDLAIASENAKFYEIMGKDSYYATHSFDAKQACESGLVSAVVREGELVREAVERAGAMIMTKDYPPRVGRTA